MLIIFEWYINYDIIDDIEYVDIWYMWWMHMNILWIIDIWNWCEYDKFECMEEYLLIIEWIKVVVFMMIDIEWLILWI